MFQLNLKNFRSFKNQDFDFSKINILIGENSSGKSSLIKFFLALKQTLQKPNHSEINFALTGQQFDLGNFKETIYYHDDSLPIEFEFTFNDYDDFFYEYFSELISNSDKSGNLKYLKKVLKSKKKSNTKILFQIFKEINSHEKLKCIITNDSIGKIEFIFPEKKNTKIDSLFGDLCSIRFEKINEDEAIILNDLSYDKEGFFSLVKGSSLHSSVLGFYNLSEEQIRKNVISKNKFQKLFFPIAYLLVVQNYLKYYIDKIEYINPIKTFPSRIYLVKDDKQATHINDIEDFVNFFSRNKDLSDKYLKDFVKILNDFGIANELEILKDERLPVLELRVKINDLFSNINDVGYGVSLQLPIILKCFLAEVMPEKRGSIIFIEQPEVHLHPKLHAKLIETILKLSKHTTYFIETHSEHIIRKLQVAVKNKKTSKVVSDDVTIHYLIRGKQVSVVTHHTIEENGRLNPVFASGFFDNSYVLSKELLN